MQKTLVITGATSGAGKAALPLLSEGYSIFLLARNSQKAKSIVREIYGKKSHSIEIITCDLASLKSVERAIEILHNKISCLHVLINNAACIPPRQIITKDHFEMQFQVNYLSHAYLTLELLPLLINANSSRVIFTSSMVHRYYTLEYNEHAGMQDYNKEIVYGKTKLAQVMFMKYLSIAGPSSVSFVAFHPGVLKTRILADYIGTDFHLLTMGENPRKGGERLAYLALTENIREYSGTYFENNVPAIPSPQANDKNELVRLFQYTTNLLQPYFRHYLPTFLNPDFQ